MIDLEGLCDAAATRYISHCPNLGNGLTGQMVAHAVHLQYTDPDDCDDDGRASAYRTRTLNSHYPELGVAAEVAAGFVHSSIRETIRKIAGVK